MWARPELHRSVDLPIQTSSEPVSVKTRKTRHKISADVRIFFSRCVCVCVFVAGAPRLLQAIAADGVIPLLNVFAVTSSSGEPRRAQLLTACIAECGILLANVDHIAPIITMSVPRSHTETSLPSSLTHSQTLNILSRLITSN